MDGGVNCLSFIAEGVHAGVRGRLLINTERSLLIGYPVLEICKRDSLTGDGLGSQLLQTCCVGAADIYEPCFLPIAYWTGGDLSSASCLFSPDLPELDRRYADVPKEELPRAESLKVRRE